MIKKIVDTVRDPILFGTAVVTVSVFISSIFSYLLQFALGRFLTVEDYGAFNALLSFSYLLTVPSAVLTTSLIKITSEHKAKNEFSLLTRLYCRLSVYGLLIGSLLFLAIMLFGENITRYLKLSDSVLPFYFGLFISVTFISSIPSAYLQGLLRFKAFAFSNIFYGFIRLGFPIVFLLIGWSLRGVFVGLFLSFIVAYLVNTLLLKKNFEHATSVELGSVYKRLFLFSVPVLMLNLSMMLLNNIDIILVKRFFDSLLAGYYAGAVTVCKVLLFGANTVAIVMFPQISETYTKGGDYMRKFKVFFSLQIFVVITGVLTFVAFPRLITGIMFGEKFMPSVPYIPLFSIFMGLYVIIIFMMMFFLALGKTGVFWMQLPIVVLQAILLSIFHRSLFDVIWVNIFISTLLLISSAVYFYVIFRVPRGSLAGGQI